MDRMASRLVSPAFKKVLAGYPGMATDLNQSSEVIHGVVELRRCVQRAVKKDDVITCLLKLMPDLADRFRRMEERGDSAD